MIECRYKEECCMRNEEGKCRALNRTYFEDGKCHFRKLTPLGKNQYDLEKGGNNNDG